MRRTTESSRSLDRLSCTTHYLFLLGFGLVSLISGPVYAEAQKPWVDTFTPSRELFISPNGVQPLKVVDHSGHAIHGLLNGSPVLANGNVSTTTGTASSAVVFDGENDFVALDSGVGTWGTSYTIEAWIKTTSTTSHYSANHQPIISAWGAASAGGHGQTLGTNGGHLSFAVGENAAEGCQDDSVRIEGSVTINDGMWHHVAATVDQSSNVISLFVDGSMDAQSSIEAIADSGCGISPMSFIGTTGPSWPNKFLNAPIDELHVFNHALTGQEIANHYSTGVDAQIPDITTLLASWNFAQPNGGTLQTPLSLEAAVLMAQPGDHFWLFGGLYEGPLIVSVDGTTAKPIVFRAYEDQRPTIRGYIQQDGAHNWFWGLEITDPDGIAPDDISGSGVRAGAPGLHLINCHIHHNLNRSGIGAWSKGTNHVFYGNIIHDAGKGNVPPNGKNWHGVYIQNSIETDGTKYFVNNALLDNNAGGNSFNFHGYATCRDCGPMLTGLHLEHNIFAYRRFLLGGYNKPPQQNVVNHNYFYKTSPQFGYARPTQVEFHGNYVGRGRLDLNWLWGTGETIYTQTVPTTITNNEIALPPDKHINFRTSAYTRDGRCEGCPTIRPDDVFDNNTYSAPFSATFFANNTNAGTVNLSQWREQTANGGNAFDLNAKEVSPPNEAKIIVLPNDYDPSRAHLVIYNWGLLDNVPTDLSSFLKNGQHYDILPIKSPWGEPLHTGTYDGNVSIPMSGSEFAVFLVKTSPSPPLPSPSNLRLESMQ